MWRGQPSNIAKKLSFKTPGGMAAGQLYCQVPTESGQGKAGAPDAPCTSKELLVPQLPQARLSSPAPISAGPQCLPWGSAPAGLSLCAALDLPVPLEVAFCLLTVSQGCLFHLSCHPAVYEQCMESLAGCGSELTSLEGPGCWLPKGHGGLSQQGRDGPPTHLQEALRFSLHPLWNLGPLGKPNRCQATRRLGLCLQSISVKGGS